MIKGYSGLLFCFIIISLSATLYAQEGVAIETSSHIDWREGVLRIHVRAGIGEWSSPGEARVAFEEQLRREIGSIFCNALYDVYLDSYRTVKEAVQGNTRLLAALMNLGSSAAPAGIHFNTYLDSLTANYKFDLYPDVIRVFAQHSIPYDPTFVLGHVPTIEYSGIVIYAKGEFPVHGEDPTRRNWDSFHPSFMPRLFDTEMELVAEAPMMDPDYLAEWGTFGYTDTTDYLEHQDRIGSTPLLTMARLVFGDYRTDLLIPVDDAKRILSIPANRKLIHQGRILIISDMSEKPVID